MATGYFDNGAPIADAPYTDAALAMQTAFPFQEEIDWPQIYNDRPLLRSMLSGSNPPVEVEGHQFGWRPPLYEQQTARSITPTEDATWEDQNIMGDFRATWRLGETHYTITYDQMKETQGDKGRIFNLRHMKAQGAIEDHKNYLE